MKVTALSEFCEPFWQITEPESALGNPLNLQLVCEVRAVLGTVPSNLAVWLTLGRYHSVCFAVFLQIESLEYV